MRLDGQRAQTAQREAFDAKIGSSSFAPLPRIHLFAGCPDARLATARVLHGGQVTTAKDTLSP